MTLGESIRNARKAKGLTQRELAKIRLQIENGSYFRLNGRETGSSCRDGPEKITNPIKKYIV